MVYFRNETKGVLDSGSHGQNFENLTVIEGYIEVSCGESKEKLSKGDTFRFQSNRDHTLKYLKTKAQVLMVNYIDPVNGSFN